MTFRYIGSKARLVASISERLGPAVAGSRFVDLFCGTGAVAECAGSLGWDVHLNDNLNCAVVMGASRLVTAGQVRFRELGGYERAIDKLNRAAPAHGFVWREYSPASAGRLGFERRYFTEENAALIDGMRRQIEDWSVVGALSQLEKALLIADLLSATNRAANIAGTYGCFLSKWQHQALERIALRARPLTDFGGKVTTSVADARDAPVLADDVVYIDPPYTKRQYAAYYHVLETIALGDEPGVSGVAGIRPWRSKASDFCYKARVQRAFSELLADLPARRLLISYSDNAHIGIDELTGAMRGFGRVTQHPLLRIPRYRPNQVARDGAPTVTEYLIELDRADVRAAA